MFPVSARVRPFGEGDWATFEPLCRTVLAEGETYVDPPETDPREFWVAAQVVVAEDEDGTLLGSAKMGPNRPGRGAHVGTASFMVDGAARGRGVGRLLGEYAVTWLREAGFRGIQFNAVVESNTAAVALWRSLGFEVVGTVPGAFRRPSGQYVGLHVMYLPLT